MSEQEIDVGDPEEQSASDESETLGDDEALGPPRGQRRKLEKAARDRLAVQWQMEGLDPTRSVEVVLRGAGIGTASAGAEIVGEGLKRVARLFRTLSGGKPFLESVAFGNSLHIELRASDAEIERARRGLQRAHDLGLDTTSENDEVRAAISEALPDVLVAAALASDLFRAPATQTPRFVAQLGASVAQAYKSLSTTVVRHEVTLDIDDPEAEGFVHLTPSKAATVAEELKSVTDPRRHVVTVIGVISLADAIHKEFALDLDTTKRKPPMLRGKRRVRGGYTPKVESKIRELGLWGRRVRARIEIERDPLLSTSTIRPPRFRLLDVEEAVT